MKIPGIYQIRNKTTNKIYIGQSIDIYRRWKAHLSCLRRNLHENTLLQNAWNKYGETDFEFTILRICEPDYADLNKWETFYIQEKNALDRTVGYNISAGGENSGNSIKGFTEEERKIFCKKISDRQKEYYKTHPSPFKGKRLSDEARRIISEKNKGNGLGVKRPEHSQAMSRGNNPKAKRVICIETGEIFRCAKDAAEKYGVTNSTLLKTCKGVQQTSAGLHWRYAD